ncbi:MAG: amino acid carrier protein [Bacilli bacterium]|nr:amino acid carrier protein [Bacilli bacterium]
MFIIIKKIIWGITSLTIVLSSIYLSMVLKFPQIKFIQIFRSLISKDTKKGQIGNIQTLLLSLAGKIGVGSIAGISLAIYIGGPGTIFWIWVISIITGVLTYSETILGLLYRNKNHNINIGGPSYYIKNGLGFKKLSKIYAIMVILSYIGGFLGVQTNTITKSINQFLNISPYLIGTVISIITLLIISKGIKKISDITSKIVPFMVLIYIISGIYIIIMNVNKIPSIILTILIDAFNYKSFFSAFLPTFFIGMQRSIFATEAGLGTGSIASSLTDSNKIIKQAYIQTAGIYITSFLICTITAFIILTNDYQNQLIGDVNGIEIIQNIFYNIMGNIGTVIIFISIFLFAFSTILTGYYYGEVSLKFIKDSNKHIKLLKIITTINLFLGCILSSEFIWNIVDMLVAVLSIINIIAILKLKSDILRETIEYNQKKV